MALNPPYTLGQPIPKVESRDKVTGRATYAADFTPVDVLWATNVRSPFAHARIVSIDIAHALRVPGVVAVLTGADLPAKRVGRRVKDMPILARDVVRFVGEKVAAVAAENPEAAAEGARLVEVEYDELPAVTDPLAAMEGQAPLVHDDAFAYQGFPEGVHRQLRNVCGVREVRKGDVEAGFAAADVVLEHTFRTQLMHQSYIEPHVSTVAMGPDGRVEVWLSNKTPYSIREELADIFERPEDEVLVHAVSVGGDFGSKGSLVDTPVAWEISRRTGRAVKFLLDSREDLTAMQPRHPSVVTLKTGVNRDGKIIARQAQVVYNTGAYTSYKPSADGMLGGAAQAGGPYEIPNVHIDGYCVYTNQVPCGYMRAPGQPQVVFAVEAHMDLLARAISMDPVEFRLRNASVGTESGEPKLAQLLRTARDAVDWDMPKGPFVGRGVAVTDRGTGSGEGSSDLTVNPDGSISVISAIPDNGTGGPTVIVQVVADTFGVAVDSIHLDRGGTDALPIDAGSGGSRMTNVAGHAALTASEQVKQQLAPLAAKMLGAESAEFVKVDSQGRWRSTDGREVSLADLAVEMIKAGDPAAHAQVTVNAPRSGERVYCAQAVEVEVDPETGDVHVRKVATVQDVGSILNPLGHQGQIEGGLMQGVGFALTEELVVEDGRITNGHFGDYKIPTMQDIPRLITINIPTGGGNGALDVKGIGELPHVPIAGAIANAVADAIGAPITQLPITAERVLEALEAARAPR